jgi:hypothetical protein
MQMARYSDAFLELVDAYRSTPIEFEQLKPITVAQWMLESGRGNSGLAKEHKNFAGMKWRPEMKPYAKRVLYKAPTEQAYFCSFASPEKFIEGFWAFLERKPYAGWKKHADDPRDFIAFIGPTWSTDPKYVGKVEALLPDAEELLGAAPVAAAVASGVEAPCCDGMVDDEKMAFAAAATKPTVEYIPSPYQFSRNGVPIQYIVLHYTTTRSIQSTINHFLNNPDTVACHYVIGRDGRIVQMVRDDRKCNHANSKNPSSIGIEHSAARGDRLTAAQEQASLDLIRWLKSEYGIRTANIIPHKCAPRSTRCPGELFEAYGADGDSPCNVHSDAVQRWLTTNNV